MVAPLKVILRSMRIAKDVKISHDHPKEDLTNVRSREIVGRTLELTIQHKKLKEKGTLGVVSSTKMSPLLEFATEGDPHLGFNLQI